MIIKTKKYQLDRNTYIKIGFEHIARKFWWAWLIPVALTIIFALVGLFWWGFGISLTLLVLYVLFWVLTFAGMPQLPQAQALFKTFTFEIDSRFLKAKMTATEGMQLEWQNIKQVKRKKDGFVLVLSMIQFLYLPNDIFRSENDLRFMEAILRRKNLIPAPKEAEKTEKTDKVLPKK